MAIVDELRDALIGAINEYRNEKAHAGKTLSHRRVPELEKLTAIVERSKASDQQDAPLLRSQVLNFIQTMEVHFLANFLPAFDSELRKKLTAILEKPEFSESVLVARERAEAKDRQAIILRDNAIIMNHLDGATVIQLVAQVKTLEKQLSIEIHQVKALNYALEEGNQRYQILRDHCEKLTIENETLLAENKQLKQQLAQSSLPFLPNSEEKEERAEATHPNAKFNG